MLLVADLLLDWASGTLNPMGARLEGSDENLGSRKVEAAIMSLLTQLIIAPFLASFGAFGGWGCSLLVAPIAPPQSDPPVPIGA